MSALQPVVAVLQEAAVYELLRKHVPRQYAETLASPFCSPGILYVRALLIVPHRHDRMTSAAYARMPYYGLFFIARIPSGRDIEAAMQKIVFVKQVLERIYSFLIAAVIQEPCLYVLRILEPAELQRGLYGVFQESAFAVLVAIEKLRPGVYLIGVEVAYSAGAFPVYGFDDAADAVSRAMRFFALLVGRRRQLPVVDFQRRNDAVYVLQLAVLVPSLEIRPYDFVLILIFLYVVGV